MSLCCKTLPARAESEVAFMPAQNSTTRQRILRPLLSSAIILGIASLLAFALNVGAATAFHQTLAARACGLANTPTMIADKNPAIPTPITPSSDPNLPVGFFPGSYYRSQAIDFTEDLSAVPDAPPLDSLQLRWDFGDGTSLTTGTAPKHTYQRSGSFAVRVSIYDSVSNSWVDFDSATITLLDHTFDNPPTAKATADKTLVAFNDPVTFDASGSQANVGSIASYEWNFGDAQDAQGIHVTHSFAIAGRALVTLIVTDSRGARSTAVVPVQVVQAIPQIHLRISAITAQVGQVITFDASQVELAPGDQVASYTWDFGDQTPAQQTTSATITHSYTKPGTYQVKVQVLDTQNIPGSTIAQITIQSAQSGSTGSLSGGTILALSLGALVVIALFGYIIYSSLQRAPVPAAKGRARTSQNISGRTPAGQNTPRNSQQNISGGPGERNGR
jgi:PKD repeat protein